MQASDPPAQSTVSETSVPFCTPPGDANVRLQPPTIALDAIDPPRFWMIVYTSPREKITQVTNHRCA